MSNSKLDLQKIEEELENMSDCEPQNIQKELEKINPTELFTPNEILDAVQIYDGTV